MIYLYNENHVSTKKEISILPVTRSIQLPTTPTGKVEVFTESGLLIAGTFVTGKSILVMPPLYTGEVKIKYKGVEITAKAGDKKLEVDDISECASNNYSELLCILAEVDDLVKKTSPKEARDLLYQYMQENRDTSENCSSVAYALAYASAEKLGVKNAASENAQFCRFSYLHGIGAYAVITGMDFNEQQELCGQKMSDMDASTVKIQCSHGLGHGYYLKNKFDVSLTQSDCEKLNDGEIATSACYEGVFMLEMELNKPYFLINVNHKEPAGYPERTQPLECAELRSYDARHGCFRYSMRVEALNWRSTFKNNTPHLQKYDKDRESFIKEMIDICKKAETEKGECQYGLGEALWQAGREYKEDAGDTLDKRLYPILVQSCVMWATGQAEQCASRLASNVTSELADLSLALEICSEFEKNGLRNTCTAEDRAKWLKMVQSTTNKDPRVPNHDVNHSSNEN